MHSMGLNLPGGRQLAYLPWGPVLRSKLDSIPTKTPVFVTQLSGSEPSAHSKPLHMALTSLGFILFLFFILDNSLAKKIHHTLSVTFQPVHILVLGLFKTQVQICIFPYNIL